MRRTIDLVGRRFGIWTVESRAPSHRTSWICRCDCGTCAVVRDDSLKRGGSISCGCLTRTIPPDGKRRHRKTGSKEHFVWLSMIRRCTNPRQRSYERYGGRGIRVCDRWRRSFEAFLSDMGHCPPGLTLERMDNEKGYQPDNCRWATWIDQANNTRASRIIEFGGRRQTVTQWAREIGIKPRTLHRRITRGMSIERALTPGDFRL
jgi:hypothetical protein